MWRRHHGEMIWEISFFVTHTGVISEWKETDGLEENLWLEQGQGKPPQGPAHRGVREAQTQIMGVCGACRERDMEHGGDHAGKRLLGETRTA